MSVLPTAINTILCECRRVSERANDRDSDDVARRESLPALAFGRYAHPLLYGTPMVLLADPRMSRI